MSGVTSASRRYRFRAAGTRTLPCSMNVSAVVSNCDRNTAAGGAQRGDGAYQDDRGEQRLEEMKTRAGCDVHGGKQVARLRPQDEAAQAIDVPRRIKLLHGASSNGAQPGALWAVFGHAERR